MIKEILELQTLDNRNLQVYSVGSTFLEVRASDSVKFCIGIIIPNFQTLRPLKEPRVVCFS